MLETQITKEAVLEVDGYPLLTLLKKRFSAEIRVLYAVVGWNPTTAYTPCFFLAAPFFSAATSSMFGEVVF
jgi:hypothetical protein